MSINQILINLGNILIGRKLYDFDHTYDRYDFLRAQFDKKNLIIKKINKSVYGKW